MQPYLDLLRNVLENGTKREDRTGVGTLEIFGTQTRYDLRAGFPAVTTKKLAFNSVVSELLWFLEGSTDERRLAEIHYGKPASELVGKRTIWTDNADNQGAKLHFNSDTVKELGPVYGAQWRSFDYYTDSISGVDQIENLITSLKTDPYSRRHILSAWNPILIDDMALPPCHVLTQFHVNNDNELSCQLYQRSADLALGVPFNVASYSLLVHMLAQVCGLKVGEFIHSIGSAHIYLDHLDGVDEQLYRKPKPLPHLKLNPDIMHIDHFQMSDIVLENYDSHPAIKLSMAV